MSSQFTEVTILDVRRDPKREFPAVLLVESSGGGRGLPIFVNDSQASAIASGLLSITRERPTTHDTLKQAVEALGGRPTQLKIEAKAGERITYTCDVVVTSPTGDDLHLDTRPSDALALAARWEPRPRIFVTDSLLSDAPEYGAVGADWERAAEGPAQDAMPAP